MQLKTAKAPPAFPVAQQVPVSKTSHPTTESNQTQHSVMASSMGTEKPRSDVFGEGASHDDEGCPILCVKHQISLVIWLLCIVY
jgi:hypothetical protein